MILTLLLNNIALAGVMCIDEHDLGQGTPVPLTFHSHSDSAPEHAGHCCHLQAHFQTIFVHISVFQFNRTHVAWASQPIDHLNSLSFSPPTPPPKV
jgi:hypothetical protein